MVNWNTPSETDSYLDILDWVRERDDHIAKFDYSGDTNIPANHVRYDTTANKFQRHNGSGTWNNLGFHSTIDSHIADASIHYSPQVGDVKMAAYATPPSGWLLCNGAAVNRVGTYAALFAKIGTSFGAGDGSATFNLPNFNLRLPMGVSGTLASSGLGLGETLGSLNHTHTIPPHQHTVASHTHEMANHSHTLPAHSHSIPTHEHTVPSHGHSVGNALATLSVSTAGGTHTHTGTALSAGTHSHGLRVENGTQSGERVQTISSGNASKIFNDQIEADGAHTHTLDIKTNNSGHTHAHSTFSGTVGAWDGATGGRSGDSNFTTSGNSLSTTNNNTAGLATTGISTNTTDGSGTLTTTAGEGGGTSGAANPPCLGIYFFIKF